MTALPENRRNPNKAFDADNGGAVAEKEADLAHLLALHNTDLRELLGHREATVEAEKRLMARQMHDTLGSSLTALNMYLALLQHEMPGEPAVLKRVEQMKTLLLSVSDATRRMQAELRPEKLDVFGIKVALQEHALDFGKRNSIACRASMPDEELDFPAGYDIALFRIVEEALANIAAHAEASRVDVVLDDSEDGVVLTIRDNGKGIAPERIAGAQTHGLRMMRERVGYLGGTLAIAGGKGGTFETAEQAGATASVAATAGAVAPGTTLTIFLPPVKRHDSETDISR